MRVKIVLPAREVKIDILSHGGYPHNKDKIYWRAATNNADLNSFIHTDPVASILIPARLANILNDYARADKETQQAFDDVEKEIYTGDIPTNLE